MKSNTELLTRFIHRETTPDEDQEVLRWILESDENRRTLDELIQARNLAEIPKLDREMNVEQEWEKFKHIQIDSADKSRTLPISNWMKVAASILILIAVGLGSIFVNDRISSTELADSAVYFESPSGEKSKVVLADQTVVWLNSSSKLMYNAREPRNVQLEGEAYFEVTKDPKHPFVVKLNNGANIRVLGTKFNVRNYPDDQFVETTLEEGKVELFGEKIPEPIQMTPGQQVLMKDSTYEIKDVDSELYSLWHKNELKFRDASFAELVPRIERWYGVQINIDPELQTRDYFTMTVKTESIRELFQMMQLTSNFNYEINGSQIQITAK